MPLKRELRKRIGYQVIDVVHYTFFDQFIDEELLPFARELRERITQVHPAIYAGEARIPNLVKGDLPNELFRHCLDFRT